jgi:hypothetical protein
MIRAIVQNGLICPLEPLPAEWNEGRQVIVEDADGSSVDELDGWYRELQRLDPTDDEADEWPQVQAVLNEADEQAKAAVRREMGLK